MASSHTLATQSIMASSSDAPSLQSQTPSPEGSQPHSPNELSTAAILATLADSRPPTSHGEYGEELDDDDQPGGISLVDDGPESAAPHPHATATPPNFTHGPFGDLMPASSNPGFADMVDASSSYAALAALSMDQLPSPSPAWPPSMAEQLFALAQPWSTQQYGNDFAPSTYLSFQDNQSFLNITAFFQRFAAPPKAASLGLDVAEVPSTITRDGLRGDSCDFQGIDWAMRYSTRASIRAKRSAFENARLTPKVREVRQWHKPMPNTENYFAFARNNTAHRAYFPHFQLRNVLAAPSRNDIYYATQSKVVRTDASGSFATPIIDISKRVVNGTAPEITTLDASDSVLFAGGFDGDYAIADLTSTRETPYTWGRIRDIPRDAKSWITNHVHLSETRHTYTPQAILCSNDYRLRILDCATNTFTNSFAYSQAVNCSATSPNGRMRAVVGDFQETLITNAETGLPIETLNSHTDDVFACAWADDGIHIATAAQDSTIIVWDARNWRQPLTTLFSELSIPRSLRFSPIGSGPRVLIAAEADDYINIINAQTFESKQVFDFFGPIGGISMTPDGQSLFVANSERRFGGLVELERTGWGEETGRRSWRRTFEDGEMLVDWEHDSRMQDDERVISTSSERSRRGMDLGAIVV